MARLPPAGLAPGRHWKRPEPPKFGGRRPGLVIEEASNMHILQVVEFTYCTLFQHLGGEAAFQRLKGNSNDCSSGLWESMPPKRYPLRFVVWKAFHCHRKSGTFPQPREDKMRLCKCFLPKSTLNSSRRMFAFEIPCLTLIRSLRWSAPDVSCPSERM